MRGDEGVEGFGRGIEIAGVEELDDLDEDLG